MVGGVEAFSFLRAMFSRKARSIALLPIVLGAIGGGIPSSVAGNGRGDFRSLGLVLIDGLTPVADAPVRMGLAPSITVIDPQSVGSLMDVVKDFRQTRPDGSGEVLLRIYEGGDNVDFKLSEDPGRTAEAYFKVVIRPAWERLGDNGKLFDVLVNTPNENNDSRGPSWNDRDGVTWWAKFYRDLAVRTHSLSVASCVTSIPVGGVPGKTKEEVGQVFSPMLETIVDLNERGIPVFLCYNAYTNTMSQDLEQERQTSLHWQVIDEYLRSQLPEGKWKFILPEVGFSRESGDGDQGGWGAQDPVVQASYLPWLRWFDDQVKTWNAKYGNVAAATIFKLGNHDWTSYDLGDELVKEYYSK